MSTPADTKISRFTSATSSATVLFSGAIALEWLSSHGAAWLAGTLSPVFAYFIVEWIYLYSRQLSRQRRAFFDEVNVLETYQPRARTHGHLFVPDPPTPGPNGEMPGADSEELDPARKAFNNTRDSHYANMYQEALRLNKEMEMQNKIGKDPCSVNMSADVELAPVVFDAQGRPAEEVKKATEAASDAASTAKSAKTEDKKTPKPEDLTSL